MSRRNASLLLGFLLLASLAIKIPGSMSGKEVAVDNFPRRVTEFLRRSGFTTEPHVSDVDMFSIAAHSGECRILVAVLSPQGWHRDIIKKLAPDGSEVFFFYDGKVYDDQPVTRTRFDDYWTRFLRYAGTDSQQPPILGIAQSPECRKHTIAWNALSAEF
jgi:hypothetical protein